MYSGSCTQTISLKFFDGRLGQTLTSLRATGAAIIDVKDVFMNSPISHLCFLYARKSTDVDDMQALSIESQLAELREYAARENISIVEELVE